MTLVPQMPAFVAGIINLRGKVIPVVDLRLKFGLTATPPTRETCIIVVDAPSGQAGLVVDAVRDVIDLGPTQLEAPPVLGEDPQFRFMMGVGKVKEELVILIDILEALSRNQVLELPDAKRLAS